MASQESDLADGPSPWLRVAAGLDWSQCEAVEMAQDKAGPIWVFRGTRIPLAHAFRDLDSGLAFGEILERHHGLTREALKAVLQFVAEGFVLQGSKQ